MTKQCRLYFFTYLMCKVIEQILGFNHREKNIISAILREPNCPMRAIVKNQHKNTNDVFSQASGRSFKTAPIQKRSMKKKRVCPKENFLQQQARQGNHPGHVFNFHNLLVINEQAIRDPQHDESFIKSYFYHKNLKRIEATEHYLTIHLNDHCPSDPPVQEVISAYRADADPRFQTLGKLLDDIQRRAAINRPDCALTSSLNAQALSLLDSLGHSAYICRISSNRLVVSQAIMEIFGYNSSDFIIECLKFRMPLFEGFSCHRYYEFVLKHLQNVILLLDYLDGRIPLTTFNELNSHYYQEIIESKNNIQYHCQMSLSMPIPLVSLIKVEKILSTREVLHFDHPMLHSKQFRLYSSRIREKELDTLQHLIGLPDNALPHNKNRVADYIERTASDEDSKSQHTHSV